MNNCQKSRDRKFRADFKIWLVFGADLDAWLR